MTDNAQVREARAAASTFLTKHTAGVLATIGPNGAPQASLVYYVASAGFVIHVLTLSASRKFENITRESRVAFTVADADVPQTVQIEGIAEEVPVDTTAAQDIVAQLMDIFTRTAHYPPLAKMDASRVALLQITPTSVRWGDFVYSGSGSENVFQEVL